MKFPRAVTVSGIVNEWMIEWKKKVCDHLQRLKTYSHVSNDINLIGVHFGREKSFQFISFSKMKNNGKSVSLSESHALHFLCWLRSFEPLTGVSVFGFEFFPASDNWVLSLKSPLSVLHPWDSRLSPTQASFLINSYFATSRLSFCFFSFIPVIGFSDTWLQDPLIFMTMNF